MVLRSTAGRKAILFVECRCEESHTMFTECLLPLDIDKQLTSVWGTFTLFASNFDRQAANIVPLNIPESGVFQVGADTPPGADPAMRGAGVGDPAMGGGRGE